MIYLQYLTFNSFGERCYVVWDHDGSCAVIDPGFENVKEKDELYSFIQGKGLKPVCCMLTHGHFDHVLGAASFARDFKVPVYMNPADKPVLEGNSYFSRMFGAAEPEMFETVDIREGDHIMVGELKFEVIETPGHTPGGVCFLERENRQLFSGDTLFAGSIGRTDHPGGDYDMLMKSIFEKLMILDGDINVSPGHGHDTSIATERMTNPFLQPFNEPYED